MTSRSQLPSLAWGGAVMAAAGVWFALMLQVTAVKSDIAETEKAIVSAKRQIATLETEFQTRARQQQLSRWNEVDFGYVAPKADQFMGEAQLASLGTQTMIGEEPVRMADASDGVQSVHEEGAQIRLASADNSAPTMMRQLAAHDDTARKAAKAEPVRVATLDAPRSDAARRAIIARLAPEAPAAAEKPGSDAARFAKSFDFGAVADNAGASRD